ncbi:MAG: hypothetical protein ACYTF9_03210 [Planctomycetota bacterium]
MTIGACQLNRYFAALCPSPNVGMGHTLTCSHWPVSRLMRWIGQPPATNELWARW